MRYIGSKKRLLPFIHETLLKYDISGHTFCDLFAGTATVGHYFKQWGFQIISCDLLYLSYIMQQVKLNIHHMPSFERVAQHLDLKSKPQETYAQEIIDYLNQVAGFKGFIYRHYAPGGTAQEPVVRKYYTDENAQKIDAIRQLLEAWKYLNIINTPELHILLYALLNAASLYANTTATMTSFLKSWDHKALKPLKLILPQLTPSAFSHQVYCQDSVALVDTLNPVDILYLDPPYTGKQYAASYHLLETLARYDDPQVHGISGKRTSHALDSALSRKVDALNALEHIVQSRCYRHLLLSYSSESLISHERLMAMLSQYGEVAVRSCALRRYNSMAHDDPRNNPKTYVKERLYYLKPYQIPREPEKIFIPPNTSQLQACGAFY